MVEIVGTWELVTTRATASDGEEVQPPYGGSAHAMGRVTFGANGRMIAVLCDSRKEMPNGLAREYTSYCGAYTFDGQRLVTRVDAASDPKRIGSDQVRDVRIEGDMIVLMPPRRDYGGSMVQRELTWRKISDA